jgi:hypothetical protein
MKLDVNKLIFSPQVIRTFRIKYRRFRFRPALLRSVKREIKAGKTATIYWQLAEEGRGRNKVAVKHGRSDFHLGHLCKTFVMNRLGD